MRNLLHKYSDVFSGKPNLKLPTKSTLAGSHPTEVYPIEYLKDSKRRSTKRLRKC